MVRRVYDPLDIAATKARVAERSTAIQTATGTMPTGRKLAFEVLLATEGRGATTNEVHGVIGGGKSPVKRALHRLEAEGLAARQRLASGDDLYRVTDHGQTVGYNYTPPTVSVPLESAARYSGWGKSGSIRIATLKVLMALEPEDEGLTIRHIMERAGLNSNIDQTVGRTIRIGLTHGYVEATTAGSSVTAGVYRLTESGRVATQMYLDANDTPAISFTVTFTGDTDATAYQEVLRLLAELQALDDVQVSGLPAPEDD